MAHGLQLKLSHKGLLLVGTLLFFELAFVGCLFFMLNQAEIDAQREAHSKEIIGLSSRVFHGLFQAGEAGAKYVGTGDPRSHGLYKEAIAELPRDFRLLKEIMKGDPDLELVERMENTGLKAIKILDVIAAAMEQGNVSKAFAIHDRYREKLARFKKQLLTDLQMLKEHQEQIILETPAAQARARQKVKYFLAGGVAANVALAIFLALLFVRTITRRIEVVVENTHRVARQEALAPALPGTDEIAHLDHTFHEMAEALEAAREREREIDRMKQEFIAMVSHDLRTPLTAIQGFIQLVSDGVYGELSPDGKDRSLRAERNIDRLMRLVNDIVDLNKMESGKLDMHMGDCTVSGLFARSIEAVAVVAEKKSITVEARPLDLSMAADEDRLVQVLVNLLGNALKFAPEGSTIELAATLCGQLVEVAVIDRGPGIPDKAKATIFERFSQVNPKEDRKKGGSGLGLSICKAIVEAHDGSIGVRDTEGGGSTFWFTLPCNTACAQTLRTPATSIEA